jgi:hypothetical protein
MTRTRGKIGKAKPQAPARAAEIVREYGPFAGADRINGVTHDGQRVWAATGSKLRTIESNRFVTGVTWVDGELWHGTWEGDESEIRRINPESGAVLERLEMPRGTGVSGLESDGSSLFYCGGGSSGKVRAVRRPKGEK